MIQHATRLELEPRCLDLNYKHEFSVHFSSIWRLAIDSPGTKVSATASPHMGLIRRVLSAALGHKRGENTSVGQEGEL